MLDKVLNTPLPLPLNTELQKMLAEISKDLTA